MHLEKAQVSSTKYQYHPEKSTVGKYQEKVVEFMKREDNSKLQPGKKDVKKGESGDKRQVNILTDYLSNLHKKFLSENPDVEISHII